MNIFIVNQNPDSEYNDKDGERYDYPLSIPNGRQISVGDILIFNLSYKFAKKMKLGESRLTGIAKIDHIEHYLLRGANMGLASYCWYKKFKKPLRFIDIGGDPRNNDNNSMNKVNSDLNTLILSNIIEFL
jgi:hypothetical protein